ncbi:fluoride efflux transporter CrcB [Shewanella sp. 202IG2-18]|uniref:fluoride efflux transporter CrcB n=1 Tax=Parashewanella hymeniacidonis TaxID=2807618 RepID=UPI0019607221|nr:fluoride efflux transporter CrcB [Parashewanella hymeniacidonis]MBM7071899.1 fluoride efflux transporter CrcB [Parashewanella hymeniacidonis]
MINLVYVALGGAVGASLRYLISLFMIQVFGTGFPFGTLLVNIIGSFFMGIVYAFGEHMHESHILKAFIGVGMLGALTTFSTFSNETLLLFQRGEWIQAFLNVLLNVGICLFMVYLGQQFIISRI